MKEKRNLVRIQEFAAEMKIHRETAKKRAVESDSLVKIGRLMYVDQDKFDQYFK